MIFLREKKEGKFEFGIRNSEFRIPNYFCGDFGVLLT